MCICTEGVELICGEEVMNGERQSFLSYSLKIGVCMKCVDSLSPLYTVGSNYIILISWRTGLLLIASIVKYLHYYLEDIILRARSDT